MTASVSISRWMPRARRHARGVILATLAPVLASLACGSDSENQHLHRPFPQVETIDGSLLSPLRLVTIASADEPQTMELFAFSDALVRSSWWRVLAREYHIVESATAVARSGPMIGPSVTDHDVFTYIETLTMADATLAPDGNTLYLLYLPPATTIVSGGQPNEGCSLFGAYHAAFGSLGDNLAVVQRCSATSTIESLTVAASHEVMEAVTDPKGRGWKLPSPPNRTPWLEDVWLSSPQEGEIGDLCVGAYYVESGWDYQRAWSNAAAARGGDPCIPATSEPYYSADVEQGWYPVAAGESVAIPVTGWSTGRVPDWTVTAYVKRFTATFQDDPQRLQAGRTVTLTVTAPQDAPSGAYAVIEVISDRPTPTAAMPRPLTDGAHIVPVGVYVP